MTAQQPELAVGATAKGLRFAALEVPQFRIYWLAGALSITGDGMENVIRNWLVWELTHSPLWLGMMVFAHWVPFTFFSLYGGVLADRYDNRKVQLVAQVILLAAALGVAAATLAALPHLEFWIFGLLLVHGFAGAIGNPAQQTLINDLVGRDRLLSAISLNSSMRQVAQVVGPLIAGWFLVALGPGWGFFANGLTFVPLLVVLMLIRPGHRAAGSRLSLSTGDSLREGFAFVRAHPTIGALIVVEMVPVVFLGHALSSLVPAIATDVLHVGSQGYVVLLAVGATGVVTQALTNTAIQLAAPDRLRGRVMGAYSFGTQGVRVLNGPILGGAAQLLANVPLAIAAASLAVIALLAAIAARVPGLRSLR